MPAQRLGQPRPCCTAPRQATKVQAMPKGPCTLARGLSQAPLASSPVWRPLLASTAKALPWSTPACTQCTLHHFCRPLPLCFTGKPQEGEQCQKVPAALPQAPLTSATVQRQPSASTGKGRPCSTPARSLSLAFHSYLPATPLQGRSVCMYELDAVFMSWVRLILPASHLLVSKCLYCIF